MFDIGWSELVVIGIVALIAIGPKELPGVLRGLGHWMGKVRRMAAEFQDQFREAMREAEVADLKKQFDDMQATASNVATGFDNPLDTARREMEKAFEDKPLAAPDAPPAVTAPEETGDVAPAPVPLGIAADAREPETTAPADAKREGSGAA
jgi:sec-independent protein translocase protein TatB